jgi:CelD/BcsL family acetyltransferase involved in cellulose biosynthesis
MSVIFPGLSLVQSTVQRLRVEAITDFDAFLNLKEAWDKLVASASVDHPFITHEWIRTWWESFGGTRTLHIVVAREGSTIVGIAPMLEETERFYGFKLRKLTFIWNAHVPRCDFIVEGKRLDVYRALWGYIAAQARRWDLLLLPQLPEGSPTLTMLKELAPASGFLVGTWSSDSSPYVTISGTWEEYLASLPRKHRSNLFNRTARLSLLGKIELEHLTADKDDVTTLDAALEEGFQIEATAWKAATGHPLLCDARVRTFYTSLARTTGIKESLRLNFLRAGDKRIAFDLSIRYANAMYVIKGGCLPEYDSYSPINILASMTLQNCFREGLERYDFLGKEEEWKVPWSRRALSHHWMFIYPNNPRTALFHAMKFRLAPMIEEWGQASGLCAGNAVRRDDYVAAS